MDFLDKICEELKEKYKIEINIQDQLYNITDNKEVLAFFDIQLSGNNEYFNNSTQLISLAHQLVFATLYRPNNTKIFSEIAELINTKYNEYASANEDQPTNQFSLILFNTVCKYLLNIKTFPSISPLIFFLRRLFERNLIVIDQIVTFLHSAQSNNDHNEIIFMSFVVFAPEIEEFNIDSYDSFYNVVEELSFAQTSDDEYQVSDEGSSYHPFRSFITHFCQFQRFDDGEEEEKEVEKWSELKKCVEEECDSSFPLLKAVKKDDVDFLQTIVSTNADFDINQRIPKTVFEPNPNANKNYFLIEFCCLFGSVKCFKYLLLNHARLPFMHHIPAIIGGNVEIIHILEQIANSNSNSSKNEEKKDDAEKTAETVETVETIENIAYTEFFPEALHYAALYHQNSIFFWLIESKGKNLIEFDFEGKTIVACAAISNNIEVLIYIIQTGIVKINFADLNYNYKIEKTPLIYACENGSFEVCKILLGQKSIQINFKNYSPIHAALSNSHFHIIRLLCERDDIDLNVTDNDGSTPLHYAILNNDTETVKMLLTSKNKQGLYQVEINRKNRIFFYNFFLNSLDSSLYFFL